METLIENNGLVEFLISFPNKEVSIYFEVYKVTSWIEDTPETTEKYISGYIKWDGCADIHFGDEEEYYGLHFCGRSDADKFVQVWKAVWDVVPKKIKNWDEDLAS